jgi:hypothetical protein
MYATYPQDSPMQAAVNKLNCAGTAQVAQKHRCSATAVQRLSTPSSSRAAAAAAAAAAGMIQLHALLLLDSSHCLCCCIVKIVCCNDLHIAAAEDLLARLNIGAFQPHNLAGTGSKTRRFKNPSIAFDTFHGVDNV